MMSNPIRYSSKVLKFALALAALGACSVPIWGQEAPAITVGNVQITGLPDDWTHHHLIFSDPGTEQEAIQAGRHEQWQKIVNDPRYVIQQLKKNLPVRGPAAVDAAYRAEWMSGVAGADAPLFEAPANDELTFGPGPHAPRPISPFRRPINLLSEIKNDWSESLGGPGLAAGQYPAKYSLSTTTASCNDYVVFPTGAAGSSSQATIAAFNNIYVGTGGCSGGPTVYWAYNTPAAGSYAATANLSPVISLDGKQVAFIESANPGSGTTAYLVLLTMANSGGTVTGGAPAAITYVTNADYHGCVGVSGGAPCYTTLPLGTTDTSSAPFYRYPTYSYSGDDTIFVGDDSGKVHEVTGVFLGTPTLDPSGWPATASAEAHLALNSPIYDSASGYIFVGDASGYLHQFLASTPGTVYNSGHLEYNAAGSGGVSAWDPPLVDSTAEHIYAFIGYSGATDAPSYINSFPVTGTNSIVTSGGYGSPSFGLPNGSNATGANIKNSTATIMRAGTFDDVFYLTDSSTGPTTGKLYTCADGNLYQLNAADLAAPTAPYNTPVSASTTCSSVSEFLGAKANTTLSVAISSGTQAYVCLASTTGIASGDYLQIGSEIMLVGTTGTGSCSSGTIEHVTRAQDGTTAGSSYPAGTAVQDINGDWIFLTVAALGTGTGCTGACLYNYNVFNAGTTGTATAGFQLPSGDTTGTSGIVIDNLSTSQAGAQMLYYSTQGGDTGVQASQSNP